MILLFKNIPERNAYFISFLPPTTSIALGKEEKNTRMTSASVLRSLWLFFFDGGHLDIIKAGSFCFSISSYNKGSLLQSPTFFQSVEPEIFIKTIIPNVLSPSRPISMTKIRNLKSKSAIDSEQSLNSLGYLTFRSQFPL